VKRTITCSDLLNRLELLLAGNLSESEQPALKAHIEACENCRNLLEVWNGEQKTKPVGSLADEVLARTSGGACSRVQSMLCDHVDKVLPENDTALVHVHLGHCTDCAQLAAILEESAAVLPQMATLNPGPFLAKAVIAATRPIHPPNRMGLLLSRLSLIFERPRFSLEAAYVGALLIFLVFGGAPTRSVGDIASATFAGFRLNLVKVVGDTPDALSHSWNNFYRSCRDRMEGTVETTQRTIGESIQSLQGYAEGLKGMSDTHLVKRTAALIQEVTLKYEEYSGNLNATDDPQARPEEPAE
jgi:predicted anti-sigma-YlaC factor YlaD